MPDMELVNLAAGLAIKQVDPGSAAEVYGLEPGDRILSINGHLLGDFLDYHFMVHDQHLEIVLEKRGGGLRTLAIDKDFDTDLGLSFTRTGLERLTRCANRCIFCFVDQMPEGLRPSLYVRDDDYRASFLQGCFITLTNLKTPDIDRIIKLKLSPLYVSVHTTDPALRREMMRHPDAGKLLDQLNRLGQGGIRVHAQVVLCPGINDGDALTGTVEDLSKLWPGVQSLALVPVGLTRFRGGLPHLRGFTPSEAKEVVRRVDGWQKTFSRSLGYPFVFAADEFYFLSGSRLPGDRAYADYPQTENGVGLARLFKNSWKKAKRRLPDLLPGKMKVVLATGRLGSELMAEVAADLNGVENLNAQVITVKNDFFGETVTVAGLLTGRDLARSLAGISAADLVILPSAAFNRNLNLTLDGMSPRDLSREIGAPVALAGDGQELVDVLLKGSFNHGQTGSSHCGPAQCR